MQSKALHYVLTIAAVVVMTLILSIPLLASSDTLFMGTHPDSVLIQDQAEVNLLPGYLERLSWGAVIAGTLITLIVTFILNLLGIAMGLTQINPEPDHASADAEHLLMGGIVWVGVSNLAALMIGGGIAAYFAGIPEPVDGVLHGIMVWAVSGVITILLVMSGVGHLTSGLAGLINSGINLTGSLASGVGQVAGGAVQTAGSAVGTAGNLTAQTLSILANGVQSSAQVIGHGMSNLSDTAIENSPDVQHALKFQDMSLDEIRLEAENLIRQAGKDPEQVKEQANAAVDDLKTAAEQAIKHPDYAGQILNIALQRVFRRGEDVASDIDRQALTNLLTEKTDMSPEEIQKQIQIWEQQFSQAKEQTKQARETALKKAEEFQQQAEQKAQEIYHQAQNRVAEMQTEAEARLKEASHEAEIKARETAQAASETFAKVAAGIAIAMLVGVAAAGIGGYLGLPKELPDVPVEAAFSPSTMDILTTNYSRF